MKLYYSPGACSLAVRILINEMQISADYEKVDLKAKITESGNNFLLINPKGAVPTIQLNDNEVLTENAVIHQYLAELHNAERLLPNKSNIKRYHVLESLNFITTELHKGMSPLFYPKITQKEEIFIPTIMRKFEYVDSRLAKNTYFCGDDYMLPDGYLFVMLKWAHDYFKLDFSQLSDIQRYYALMLKRDSVVKSLIDEQLQ